MVHYIENRKILGSAKKKRLMRGGGPNNNNDLADISLNRKKSDTISVDEENAIVSHELNLNSHSS